MTEYMAVFPILITAHKTIFISRDWRTLAILHTFRPCKYCHGYEYTSAGAIKDFN